MTSVVVVKVGARTAVGLDARQTGFLLRAGFPAMSEAPIANAAGESITMALVPTLDFAATGAERLATLARPPFEEAIASVKDATAEVHIAIDEDCIDAELVAGMLEGMVRRTMKSATVKVEPGGEAALGKSLPDAIRKLEARHVEVVVLGGVHSDYDPRAITALETSGRLFSRKNLDARIPGEAAAFLVLMREGDAPRRGLLPLARLLGVGAGRERATPDNEDPAYEAFGLTSALRQATEGLRERGETAGWMLTDLTGEMRRLYEWQSVFVRAQKVLGNPYIIESPAQRIGYLGAAAMPLFVAMAATAWEHGYAPSPTAIGTAGNDGGERAAIVLGKI